MQLWSLYPSVLPVQRRYFICSCSNSPEPSLVILTLNISRPRSLRLNFILTGPEPGESGSYCIIHIQHTRTIVGEERHKVIEI